MVLSDDYIVRLVYYICIYIVHVITTYLHVFNIILVSTSTGKQLLKNR